MCRLLFFSTQLSLSPVSAVPVCLIAPGHDTIIVSAVKKKTFAVPSLKRATSLTAQTLIVHNVGAITSSHLIPVMTIYPHSLLLITAPVRMSVCLNYAEHGPVACAAAGDAASLRRGDKGGVRARRAKLDRDSGRQVRLQSLSHPDLTVDPPTQARS